MIFYTSRGPKTTVCLVLYKWAVHTTVCVPPPLYIYISCIKCNVVTLYERIFTCFIIYKNAILTFLTLFVKHVTEKKIYKFYVEKIMKIEKRLRDFYTSRGPKTKLYVWYCTNELYIQLYVCLPPYICRYIIHKM